VVRHDLMKIMSDECEYIVVELTIANSSPILISSLYRPPNTDIQKFNKSLANFLKTVTSDGKTVRREFLLLVISTLIFSNIQIMLAQMIF